MDDQIVAIYCLGDDVLKALDHYEDPQRQMSDAEVMATVVVAALHVHGHWERARDLLSNGSYIPRMLGKSRFNRRLYAIGELFLTLFQVLSFAMGCANFAPTVNFPVITRVCYMNQTVTQHSNC